MEGVCSPYVFDAGAFGDEQGCLGVPDGAAPGAQTSADDACSGDASSLKVNLQNIKYNH